MPAKVARVRHTHTRSTAAVVKGQRGARIFGARKAGEHEVGSALDLPDIAQLAFQEAVLVCFGGGLRIHDMFA